MSNRENIEKDKKAVFAKDIVQKNPIFTTQEIDGYFHLFNLYADERRQANISDMLLTARTLDFHKKHPLVFRALQQISDEHNGEWIRFETFLQQLTHKLGTAKTEEGRRAMFELVDHEGKEKLSVQDLFKVSDGLGFGLTYDEIQGIVKSIAGPNEKHITWEQFNEQVAKRKLDKKGQ